MQALFKVVFDTGKGCTSTLNLWGNQPECVLLLLDRQKQRENKKFSKAVQAERQKEKVQQKKANISDITKLRKQRQKQASFQWQGGSSIPVTQA